MTRKDYKMIAEIIRFINDETERARVAKLAAALIIEKDTNPNFDKQKFLDACK